MFEKSIVKKTKSRRRRLNEIKRKEKNINNELLKEYFTDYQSPSNMYKKLRKTEGASKTESTNEIKGVINKKKILKVLKNYQKNIKQITKNH